MSQFIWKRPWPPGEFLKYQELSTVRETKVMAHISQTHMAKYMDNYIIVGQKLVLSVFN